MGICSSCESVPIATAKLIHEDGQLQEFSYSVKVSYLLQKQPLKFICHSDSMEFDSFLIALHCDEELRPGHLYFSLPLSKLKNPLQAEEMAALAVKASFALTKTGNGYCLKEMDHKEQRVNKEKEQRQSSICMRNSRKSCCRGSGRNFTSTLTKIQE